MPGRVLATIALLVALATAGSAVAGRFDFKVIGVRGGDTLNIRERVDDPNRISGTPIRGRIPAGANGVAGTGATMQVGSSRWYEVSYGGTRGWVNGRFLVPTNRKIDHELQSALFCSGTEPFWSVKIGESEAELTEPAAPPKRYSVAAREPLDGRKDALAVRLVSDSAPEISALIQHKEWCSDGMSDLQYGFEAQVLGLDDSAKPRRGCCSLLR